MFEEMLLFGSKDACPVASPGASDVGGLGIELLGGYHDLVVGAALGLVTGNHIAVAEMAESGRYELPFPRL